MRIKNMLAMCLSTGLALFAMFFGAGNMVFPMQIGVDSGLNLVPSFIGFFLSGVLVPFVGVFAASLYEGNYWKYFSRLGKVNAFLVITFLILIIGPLFAAPRTEVITFHTLQPLLPSFLNSTYAFNALYFGLVFLITYKQSRIVDIIAWIFSPIKIISFLTLIILGCYTGFPLSQNGISVTHCFSEAITTGYSTMDLFGAFFFCSVVYKNIVFKTRNIPQITEQNIRKIMLISCFIGASLVSLVYLGFMYIADLNASLLQNIPTEDLIVVLSNIVLGKFGVVFVSLCVTIACLATAATLAEVSTDYFYLTIFKGAVPRVFCLICILFIMSLMASLGFSGIMDLASPILNILYPLLIVFTLYNIYQKFKPVKVVEILTK